MGTTTRRVIPRRNAEGRKSNPDTSGVFSGSSNGFIARRSMEGNRKLDITTFESLTKLATSNPMELLMALPDVLPEFGKALWNDLRLACAPGNFSIKAVSRHSDGSEEDAPDGTYALRQMFDAMPKEVGNANAILSQNMQMIMFTGMCAVECVAARGGRGLAEIWPFNTLTLRFRRENGELVLYQRQRGATSTTTLHGFEKMPMERCFWAKLDGPPDDPYGRAAYAPALGEALASLAFMRDLSVAWHRVGVPRLDIGFDFETYSRIAKEIMQIDDEEQIAAWVQEQFSNAIALYNNLAADDAYFHDKNTTVNAVGSGDHWTRVDTIYNTYRWRLITALKQMPTLMGITEGNTETWSSVEWQIYAKGLEAMVDAASIPIVDAANMHLQLSGMPYVAVPVIQPVRSSQRLQEAQAEQMEVLNAINKVKYGWWSNDDAALAIVGKKALVQDVTTLPLFGGTPEAPANKNGE